MDAAGHAPTRREPGWLTSLEFMICVLPVSVLWLTWAGMFFFALPPKAWLTLLASPLGAWLGGGLLGVLALWSSVLTAPPRATDSRAFVWFERIGLLTGLGVAATYLAYALPGMDWGNALLWTAPLVTASASAAHRLWLRGRVLA